MQLGIFSKVFPRPSVEESMDAVRAQGLGCVQFNMATAGLASMPRNIEPALCHRIRESTTQRGITIAAVSGTFNMCHPDEEHRRDGLERLATLAAACPHLGTSIITLCTGTRSTESMWQVHPDNNSREAWRVMARTVSRALELCEDFDLTLAFEPEVSNVVDSAQKARRLLDEMRSPHLKVVIDPANVFHSGELPRMHEILQESFTLLGGDIALAHAKDLSHDGEAGHEAAGFGMLDYDAYLGLLHSSRFDGAIVLHGLVEAQVAQCVTFMREKLSRS